MTHSRSSCDDASLLQSDAHAFAAFYRRHEDRFWGSSCAGRAAGISPLTSRRRHSRVRWKVANALMPRSAMLARGCLASLAASWRRVISKAALMIRCAGAFGMEPLQLDDEALARIDALDADPASAALDGSPTRSTRRRRRPSHRRAAISRSGRPVAVLAERRSPTRQPGAAHPSQRTGG